MNLFWPKNKREHFQALGHRRWGRRILPVEGAPWNVCQTRYREFPKFEKHLELDTALFFLPEVWRALRVADTAPFFLELIRRRYGSNPSSSKSTESSRWQRRQKRGAKDSPLDLANKPRAKSNDARQAPVPVAKENIPLLASVSPCWRTFPTSVDNNISHRPLSPYTERQPIRASYSGN